MKKLFIILPATVTITAVIFYTGYKKMNERHEAYQQKIQSARQYLKAIPAVPTKEEWIVFKSEAETIIRANEGVILKLKSKIEMTGKKNEIIYKKELANLEEQLRFEKARLEAFGKSPANWESFKPGFNNEMDEIGKTLKRLADNFGKPDVFTRDNKQSDTYIARLGGRK